MVEDFGHHTCQETGPGPVANDLMKTAIFLRPSLCIPGANEFVHFCYRVPQAHAFLLCHMETGVPAAHDLDRFEQTKNFDYRLGFDRRDPSAQERLDFYVTISLQLLQGLPDRDRTYA